MIYLINLATSLSILLVIYSLASLSFVIKISSILFNSKTNFLINWWILLAFYWYYFWNDSSLDNTYDYAYVTCKFILFASYGNLDDGCSLADFGLTIGLSNDLLDFKDVLVMCLYIFYVCLVWMVAIFRFRSLIWVERRVNYGD